jgi:hypothetical protein
MEPLSESGRRRHVDVLIVTAVKDERDGVLECEADWEESPDPDPGGFTYHVRRDPGGLNWALARAFDMGGTMPRTSPPGSLLS